MSEDPIGLEGGINLYQFAAGDPVNLSDPSGLATYVGCRPFDAMSERTFDIAIINAAQSWTAFERGRGYSFGGWNNSNRFIYDIVTAADGRVPVSVTSSFLLGTPGLCGGWFWSGRDCR